MATTWKTNFDLPEPLGRIGVEVSEQGVTQVSFGGFAKVDAKPDGSAAKHLADAEAALRAYAAGAKAVDLPKLDLQGTEFRLKVWKSLAKLGWGKTLSYQELAGRSGVNPMASRAVGSAMANNPIPIFVPCHRVLAANKKIGGFTGGTERKRALLLHEGASFKDVVSAQA